VAIEERKVKVFKLPDLGEGLAEAEIVEWHVKAGDEVAADAPLVSLETDKAVVEVPSPRAGRIGRCHGSPGDVVRIGEVLVEFDGPGDEAPEKPADKGAVVGEVRVSDDVVDEPPSRVGGARLGVKATPAVRALANRLDVDLSIVTPSGPDGLITRGDVERVAKIFAELGPIERLRGPRRVMARNMSMANAEVAPATVTEDADIGDWRENGDVTLRLIRAIVAGCRAEPCLNAWYDSHSVGRRVLEKIHLGVAVDTADGLFVPVLRDVGRRERADLAAGIERLTADTRARTVPPEEMRGQTLTLSNFGALGGRYAGPIVVPPTVAIVGAGRAREAALVHAGALAVGRLLPLSLTFDHRAVTGGEATRFLVALITDLEHAE
jgi:pyruvate dehydrogenase E2 component (dihydrolipoamide acetyltransferase)